MHPKLRFAVAAIKSQLGPKWFEEPDSPDQPGFYIAKEVLREILAAPVFIHPQDNELLAFIDGEMHRTPIVVN